MTGGQELIDELRGEITKLRAEVQRYVDAAMERNDALEGPMGALEAENERLTKALRPFAVRAEDADRFRDSDTLTIETRHLHAARRALTPREPAASKVEFIVDSQFPELQPPAPQMSYAEARAQVFKQMRECEERVAAERRAEAPAPPAAEGPTLELLSHDEMHEIALRCFHSPSARDAGFGKIAKAVDESAQAQLKNDRAALNAQPAAGGGGLDLTRDELHAIAERWLGDWGGNAVDRCVSAMMQALLRGERDGD